MHAHSMDTFRHGHVFLGEGHEANERKTWFVIVICTAMMVAEIIGGTWFGSVALVADGLHMSTHTAALLIAALAYNYSRRHATDERFAFGTGKLGDLAAFASAIVLAMVSILIGYESIERFFYPVPIAFDEALPIAVLGLLVNIASALLLRDDHAPHGHERGHAHQADHQHDRAGHAHYRRDNNLRAAFVHMVADAFTSVLVIVALLTARIWGWLWIDPLVGLVGAIVVASWSWSLLRAAGGVLLDVSPDPELSRKIAERLEVDGDRISDLHLWRLGPGHVAGIVSLVSHQPAPAGHYKRRLSDLRVLSHLTVEVELCTGEHE